MFSDWINVGVKVVTHMSNQVVSDAPGATSANAEAVGTAATTASTTTATAAASATEQAGQVVSQAATSVGQAATTLGQTASEITSSPGMLEFIQQSDIVGQALFAILVIMSLITWYLIVVKSLLNFSQRRRSQKFLDRFWSAASLQQVDQDLHQYGANDPFSRLSNQALHASDHYARYGASNLAGVGTSSEFITRSMRKVLDEETARVENGLTILGSIGSTAPFVGLFGTVWGVYHALIGIGLSDGVSIGKIAGPVGEALIMTGLGLAVAIPAVLAFNAFVRRNRVMLSQLDGFAHDLFAFLTTGQQVDNTSERKLVLPSQVTNNKGA